MAFVPYYPAIPMLFTSGTHYEVGYNIGVTFADRIQRFWNESTEVKESDLPYSQTEEGQKFYDTTLAVCKKNFPQYIRELEGMADGAGMEFRQLFILNLSKEVHNVLHTKKPQTISSSEATQELIEDPGCSDIFLNKPGCKFVAHNEDCDPQIKPYGFIVKARIVEEGEEVENFTAYCYPGVLPGTSVAFNTHGLFISMNGLYPAFVASGAPTRMFVNRSCIRAKSVEDAINLAKNPGFGSAYGFTANIVDVNKPESLWSLEVAPRAGESDVHLQEIPEGDPGIPSSGYYMHFNCYKHNDTVAQIPNRRSSSNRAKTAGNQQPPTNLKDMLAILGNTSNSDFPIYRTERPTDRSETIFTAVLDVLQKKVHFYQGNPGQACAAPLLTLRMFDD